MTLVGVAHLGAWLHHHLWWWWVGGVAEALYNWMAGTARIGLLLLWGRCVVVEVPCTSIWSSILRSGAGPVLRTNAWSRLRRLGDVDRGVLGRCRWALRAPWLRDRRSATASTLWLRVAPAAMLRWQTARRSLPSWCCVWLR